MKKYLASFAVCFLIIIAFILYKFSNSFVSLVPIEDSAVEFEFNTGVQVYNKSILIDDIYVDINFLVVDLKNSGLEVGISSPQIFEGKDRSSYSGFSLSEYLRLGGYVAVQSGGFMSSYSPPKSLGYLKIRNRQLNPSHDSWLTTGAFCSNGKEYSIFHYKNNIQFDAWLSCMQAGPILVENEEIVLDDGRNTGFIAKKRQRQSFLCELADKKLLMGIAENVRLDKLVQFLSKAKNKEGFDCINAVALNGNDIAGLTYALKPDPKEIGNVDAPLPNAIVIK